MRRCLAVAVDGAVEVAAAPCDLHVGLVDVPGSARLAASHGAEPFLQQRCEARLPATNGLVRDLVATLEQQLRDISGAELVAQPPQHGEQHDVGRVVELVEAGAGPLVESPPAGAAAEPAVAKLRAVSPLGCRARSTVRTGHGRLGCRVGARTRSDSRSDWRFGCPSASRPGPTRIATSMSWRRSTSVAPSSECDRSRQPKPATARCSPGYRDSVGSSVSASKGPVAMERDSRASCTPRA